MPLPTNDDFSNSELSVEELEAIAAGFSLSGAWHWIKHEASTVLHYAEPVIAAFVKTIEPPWKTGKHL